MLGAFLTRLKKKCGLFLDCAKLGEVCTYGISYSVGQLPERVTDRAANGKPKRQNTGNHRALQSNDTLAIGGCYTWHHDVMPMSISLSSPPLNDRSYYINVPLFYPPPLFSFPHHRFGARFWYERSTRATPFKMFGAMSIRKKREAAVSSQGLQATVILSHKVCFIRDTIKFWPCLSHSSLWHWAFGG